MPLPTPRCSYYWECGLLILFIRSESLQPVIGVGRPGWNLIREIGESGLSCLGHRGNSNYSVASLRGLAEAGGFVSKVRVRVCSHASFLFLFLFCFCARRIFDRLRLFFVAFALRLLSLNSIRRLR